MHPKFNDWANWIGTGRPRVYQHPLELLAAAEEYFDYVDAHPWLKKEALKSGAFCGELIDVPTQAPYTLSGLCLHLNISRNTFHLYETDSEREDFHEVCRLIKDRIYNQKYTGAAVGAFNSNLITRDLQLTDKQIHEHTGAGGGPVRTITTDMTPQEAAQAYKDMINCDKD